jgi:2-aminoadipate transaminase
MLARSRPGSPEHPPAPAVPAATAAPHEQPRCAEWLRPRTRSLLRQMVDRVSQPGILSLAGGLPAPELFPAREYGAALAQVLAGDPRALQYGAPFAPLKGHVVGLLAERGIACAPDDVVLTSGAQQALSVAAGLLLEPGSTLALERLVYTGVQEAVARFQPRVLALDSDLETGLDVDELERLLERGERPAFVYVIPEGHNPLGVSLDERKRRRLAELACRHGVPLVEDDPYGMLVYEGAAAPTLKSMAPDWVLYVSTFSKVIAPALRLGYMAVPASLRQAAVLVKEAGDLESSALTQRAVAAYLEAGHLPSHLERLRSTYRTRRDAMLEAIAAHFPAGTRWTRPRAGMFVWVELPGDVDTVALLDTALRDEKLAFVPGRAFSVGGQGARASLRLSFANQPPEVIRDGVRRLARLIG